jgi:WD40 repeat protein
MEDNEILTVLESEYGITCVDAAPDGSQVMAGTEIGQIQVWWVRNGHIRTTLEGHAGSITSVKFSPNSRLLISADCNGQFMLWEMGKQVHGKLAGIYHTAHGIGDVLWQDNHSVLVVDRGGARHRPFFYHLQLEGT